MPITDPSKFYQGLCDAPIPQVRRRHCDVYTQVGNTLTYYSKHQYRKESECGSTVVTYIPTEKYKYMVITESDTILQGYYITRKYKSTSYEEIQKLRDAHE